MNAQYEYVTVSVVGNITEALNKAGEEGWIVSTFLGQQQQPDENGVNQTAFMFVLYRPKSHILKPTDQDKKILKLEK